MYDDYYIKLKTLIEMLDIDDDVILGVVLCKIINILIKQQKVYLKSNFTIYEYSITVSNIKANLVKLVNLLTVKLFYTKDIHKSKVEKEIVKQAKYCSILILQATITYKITSIKYNRPCRIPYKFDRRYNNKV